MHHFKQFVRETGERARNTETSGKFNVAHTLRGHEARQFYEEIIQGSSENKTSVKSTNKVTINIRHTTGTVKLEQAERNSSKKVSQTNQPVYNKTANVWKAAETNDVQSLNQILLDVSQINAKDSFGWTPLMCAAGAGAEDTAKVLLKAGADIHHFSRGYDAQLLAKRNGHIQILELLTKGLPPPVEKLAKCKRKLYKCELCKNTFSTGRKAHESSTVHLLAAGCDKSRTFYGIPDSNRGFQLLMKNGWDRECGLGPEKAGRKFPIKAALKNDRKGIGAREKKKNLKDKPRDVIPPQDGHSKSRRERCLERNFRMEFS